MSATAESLALLRRIAVAVEKLAAALPTGSSGAVASDRDLDGKYGNPELKFIPRDWTGPNFKGRKFSDCPPELLDMVAETFEYFARKADENDERTEKGKPVADFKRADAARARGWARRIRDGKHVQTQQVDRVSDFGASDDPDIPF